MKLVFKIRGLIMVPPMLLAVLCTWGEVEVEVFVFGLGGLVFLLGLGLRFWAQLHLRYRLRVKKTLTTTGPYAYTRNPIYIGNTLLLAGMSMLAELFWLVPIQVLYCAVIYHFVVAYEEARLSEKYGLMYLDYMSRVPRWIPKLRPSENYKMSLRSLLIPAALAEAHNLLLLLPAIIKEVVVA